MQDLSKIAISAGGTSGLWNNAATTRQVIVIHDTESNGAKGSINWMRTQKSGSYHVIVDLNGDAYRLVPDSKQAWAAMSTGNRIGLHICATGYASWKLNLKRLIPSKRSTAHDGICTDDSPNFAARKATVRRWADNPKMLEEIAQQIARWSVQYKIPLVWLTPADVRAGKRGVCDHHTISLAFRETDHTDPGPSFPRHKVLDRAKQIVSGIAGDDLTLGMSQEQLNLVSDNFKQLGLT